MKKGRLFLVAASLGMFASTVAAAGNTQVTWSNHDSVINVDLGEKVVAPTLTATVTSSEEQVVKGSVYGIDPEVNKENGWTWTNAICFTDAKDAIDELSLNGMRFLAPGAAENEGSFVNQITGKTYTTEELLAEATEKGLIEVVLKGVQGTAKTADEIAYILVKDLTLYTTSKNEVLAGTSYWVLEPTGPKYEDEAVQYALALMANGLRDGAIAGVDMDDFGKAIADLDYITLAPNAQPGVYKYYVPTTEDGFVEIKAGNGFHVETYKGSYVVKDADDDDFAEFDDGYLYFSGESVTKFAEGKNYLKDHDDDGLPTSKVLFAKNATYLNQADGYAYAVNGSKIHYSTDWFVGKSPVYDGDDVDYYKYDGASVVVDALGTTEIISKADIYTELVKSTAGYAAVRIIDADGDDHYSFSTKSYEWDPINLSLNVDDLPDDNSEVDPDTDPYVLVFADEGGDYTTKAGIKYSIASATDYTQAKVLTGEVKGLYKVTGMKDGKITIAPLETVYEWALDGGEGSYAVTVGAGKTQKVQGSTMYEGLNYYYKNYKQVYTKLGEAQLLSEAKDLVINYGLVLNPDEVLAGDEEPKFAVYTQNAKIEKADTILDSSNGVYYSITDLYEIDKKESDVDSKTKLTKSNAISMINVDDKDGNFYRQATFVPEKYLPGSVQGAYYFNVETGLFEFVKDLDAVLDVDYDDLEDETLYVGKTKLTDENVAELYDRQHRNGYYFVTSPENDTDSVVVLGYDRYAGLDLTFSANPDKKECYVELPNGTTVTTSAVELTVDKKTTLWFPAFASQEEAEELLIKAAGLTKSLEGTSDDKKETTFKAWYDAAKADVDSAFADVVLPLKAEVSETKVVDSTSSEVTVSSNLAEVQQKAVNAGIYDLTYTASYNGAEVGTEVVKVVVAPKYVRTWENGKVKTLTSYYPSNETAKRVEYVYDWSSKTASVTYFNLDGSVADTATVSL